MVCEGHSRLLESQDRVVLLGGLVSTLDICLKSLSLRRDPETLRRLRSQRAGRVWELAAARQDLRAADDEFSQD